MSYENAEYVLDLAGNRTAIVADVDGAQMSIPIAEGNRHYRELIASGVPIATPDVSEGP